MLLDLANEAAVALQLLKTYIQKNAWQLIFLLVAGYYLKTKVLDKAVAAASGPRDTVNRQRSLEQEMRRVRLQQQEEASRRAKLHQEQRQRQQQEEKRKKADAVKLKKNKLDEKKNGKTLGFAEDNPRTYNALNPSHNQAYRPARRTTRRS